MRRSNKQLGVFKDLLDNPSILKALSVKFKLNPLLAPAEKARILETFPEMGNCFLEEKALRHFQLYGKEKEQKLRELMLQIAEDQDDNSSSSEEESDHSAFFKSCALGFVGWSSSTLIGTQYLKGLLAQMERVEGSLTNLLDLELQSVEDVSSNLERYDRKYNLLVLIRQLKDDLNNELSMLDFSHKTVYKGESKSFTLLRAGLGPRGLDDVLPLDAFDALERDSILQGNEQDMLRRELTLSLQSGLPFKTLRRASNIPLEEKDLCLSIEGLSVD